MGACEAASTAYAAPCGAIPCILWQCASNKDDHNKDDHNKSCDIEVTDQPCDMTSFTLLKVLDKKKSLLF